MNNKGITLISLIIIVLVLLILASVGVIYATNTINSAKLTSFVTQLEMVEARVKLMKENNEYSLTYENFGISDTSTIDKIASLIDSQLSNEYNISSSQISDYKSRFKYYSKDNIKSQLGIEGIDLNVIIDAYDGIVISLDGLKYKGVTFYSIKHLENYGVATSSNDVKTSMKKYQMPYIPEGYYYVGGAWNTGLVISDNSADKASTTIFDKEINGNLMANCLGNLYVWIPVIEQDPQNNYQYGIDWSNVSSENDKNNIKQAIIGYVGDTNYSTQSNYSYYDSEGTEQNYTYGNLTEIEYEDLRTSFEKSIYKYGGFYVAAYEMGIDIATSDNINSLVRTKMNEYNIGDDKTLNTKTSIRNMSTPISKANSVPYINITQPQAQLLAEKVSDNINIKTSLLFSYQREMINLFIKNFYNDKYRGNFPTLEYTLNRGFYNSGNQWKVGLTGGIGDSKNRNETWFYTTGACDSNSALHIYDYAGNVAEYTLDGTRYYGGNYTTDVTAYYRDSNPITAGSYTISEDFEINYYSDKVGARITLWQK